MSDTSKEATETTPVRSVPPPRKKKSKSVQTSSNSIEMMEIRRKLILDLASESC